MSLAVLARQFSWDKVVEVCREQAHTDAITAKDEIGISALHYAAKYGNELCVKELLVAGAFADTKTRAGMTPLIMAAMEGELGCLKLLLAADADPTIAAKDGNTAVHYASQKGHWECIQFLVAFGASIDATNQDGNTPLDVANSGFIRKVLREADAEAQAGIKAEVSTEETM